MRRSFRIGAAFTATLMALGVVSGLLYEQSATKATAHSSIQAQVDSMKERLTALSATLSGAISGLLGTPNAPPTP